MSIESGSRGRSLADELQAAADAGRLLHLSVAPSRKEWQCSYRPDAKSPYRIIIHKDPVEAIFRAMKYDPDIEELL